MFESLPSYRGRYRFEPAFDDLRTIDFKAGPVAIKVPKRSSGERMTPGLPFLLEDLLAIVPEPRVIFWQVRHPLDAICSLRPGITADWSHNPKPPDWMEWQKRPVIMQCARHWQHINETGYRAVRDIAAVMHYEDLVCDPHYFARQVCDKAGIDMIDHAEGIEAWAARVGNAKSPDSYEAKRQTHWSRQDHTTRVERWRENMSPEDVEMVRPVVETAARLHGYDLPERVSA
ncbi:hypothetical protein CAK95_19090 [Pseudorhodoplanes sinuspersici]|uniref:Sulfotransferase domain-containing protein n=1 Tax=Pseudorhodoplanes sinuspersici TaxID=1235591 RepID=A0A1W6ZUF2_9HYPH|nr:hypothetical protein CAK95_19090 [Pseudorhodoplanes sinuspersici]